MTTFGIRNAQGRIVLQATDVHTVTRLARTRMFRGTPVRYVFGEWHPIAR